MISPAALLRHTAAVAAASDLAKLVSSFCPPLLQSALSEPIARLEPRESCIQPTSSAITLLMALPLHEKDLNAMGPASLPMHGVAVKPASQVSNRSGNIKDAYAAGGW